MNKTLNLALCQGRHDIPQATDGSIFGSVIDNMTDTNRLESTAFHNIWNAAYDHHKQGESGYLRVSPDWDGCDMEPLMLCPDLHINIYVTGLTVALIASLNAMRKEGISVTLYHYDKDTDSYFPQEVA